MKNINSFSKDVLALLLIAISLITYSCSKDTEQQENAPSTTISLQPIKISGSDASSTTKTTLNALTTVWVGGIDRVGVYCPQAITVSAATDPDALSFLPQTKVVAGQYNTPYTASTSTAVSDFTGSMAWGANVPHNFYAYYPYSASAGANSSVIPISLPTAQAQASANNSAHIGALDFLVATPLIAVSPGSTSNPTNVHFRYNHVFTIIEFQIKGTGALKAVKLVGTSNPVAFSGGTINITQTTPTSGVAYTIAGQTGTTTQAVVTLTSAATLTATNTDTKVYMAINPGAQTGSCLIGLSSDGTNWTYISKAAPAGGFLRGMKYVVTIDKADAASPVDQDNNTFNIVTIGNQTWMAENLKTTKYRDGSLIGTTTPATLDASDGDTYPTPKYQWAYAGTESNVATYGRLYTWYAATDSRNICPTGWHLPTDAEWTTLTNFLGGESVAGGKLKETGTTHWTTPNTGATNSYGFTALPGGYRFEEGTFAYIGNRSNWWSSTEDNSSNAFYRRMVNNETTVYRYSYLKKAGYYVRCLRDN